MIFPVHTQEVVLNVFKEKTTLSHFLIAQYHIVKRLQGHEKSNYTCAYHE